MWTVNLMWTGEHWCETSGRQINCDISGFQSVFRRERACQIEEHRFDSGNQNLGACFASGASGCLRQSASIIALVRTAGIVCFNFFLRIDPGQRVVIKSRGRHGDQVKIGCMIIKCEGCHTHKMHFLVTWCSKWVVETTGFAYCSNIIMIIKMNATVSDISYMVIATGTFDTTYKPKAQYLRSWLHIDTLAPKFSFRITCT